MDKTVKLIINIKEPDIVYLELKRGRDIIGHQSLTSSQGFDTLLIRAIDKLLDKNRIDRLSLEGVEIRGKMRHGAVSAMTVKTLKSALGA